MLHCTALFSQELQLSVLHAQRHRSSPTAQRLHSPPHAVVRRHAFTPSSLKPQPLPGIKRVVSFGWKGLLHMTEDETFRSRRFVIFGRARLPSQQQGSLQPSHRTEPLPGAAADPSTRQYWSIHHTGFGVSYRLLQDLGRGGSNVLVRVFTSLISEAGSLSLNLQLHTWRATAVEV